MTPTARRATLVGACTLASAALAGCSTSGTPGKLESNHFVELRRQLEDDHNRGVISDEEYQLRRAELTQRSYAGDWV